VGRAWPGRSASRVSARANRTWRRGHGTSIYLISLSLSMYILCIYLSIGLVARGQSVAGAKRVESVGQSEPDLAAGTWDFYLSDLSLSLYVYSMYISIYWPRSSWAERGRGEARRECRPERTGPGGGDVSDRSLSPPHTLSLCIFHIYISIYWPRSWWEERGRDVARRECQPEQTGPGSGDMGFLFI